MNPKLQARASGGTKDATSCVGEPGGGGCLVMWKAGSLGHHGAECVQGASQWRDGADSWIHRSSVGWG